MENVYSVFKPFYLFSKMFGAFPMSFEGSTRNGVMKTKVHDVFISFLSLCFFFFLLIVKIHNKNAVRSASNILAIAWNYSVVVELLFLVVQLSFQVKHCREMKSFLKLLHSFDIDAKQLGLQVNFKQHKKFAIFSVFLVIAINFTSGLVTVLFYYYIEYVTKMNWIIGYAYAHKNLFKLFFAFQLLLVCFSVKDRFKLLNEYLM